MTILTNSGRSAIAIALIDETFHLAWGNGSVSWDTTPQNESVELTDLVAEVGRRVATQISYCEADEEGEIEVSTGRYSLTESPTNTMYLRFTFDFGDASDQDIREAGIFMGTIPVDGLPPEQKYFTPEQLEDSGTLVLIERFPVVHRSVQNREQFEYVLVI